MILIGLGSNLSGQQFDTPRAVLEAALAAMPAHGIFVKDLSRFYTTEPVPKSDQPWFVNAVARVECALAPQDLLNRLHDIETGLGRARRIKWEARIIDLDIIALDDQVIPSPDRWPASGGITIPHPRLHERLFVLKPLQDICPGWSHPVLGKTVEELITAVENSTEQSLQTII